MRYWIIPCSKSFRSLFLPILTFNRIVTESFDACLPVLYSKPCDSLSVGGLYFHKLGAVPNKLTSECMCVYIVLSVGESLKYHINLYISTVITVNLVPVFVMSLVTCTWVKQKHHNVLHRWRRPHSDCMYIFQPEVMDNKQHPHWANG